VFAATFTAPPSIASVPAAIAWIGRGAEERLPRSGLSRRGLSKPAPGSGLRRRAGTAPAQRRGRSPGLGQRRDREPLPRRAGRAGYASADPLGANSSGTCQLFSIDTLGTGLRQLTHFSQPEYSVAGCAALVPPGCIIHPSGLDAATGTLVFGSSCDP